MEIKSRILVSGLMLTVPLHLIDEFGDAVPPVHQAAIESAYRWAVSEFPLIDTALVATWAEAIAASMANKKDEIASPRRYAVSALHGRIQHYFRSGGLRERTVGASRELELWAGMQEETNKTIERSILFDQLETQLNERDKMILVLLRQDVTSPADIADSLAISYDAAAKAIQRVRERLREILSAATLQKGGTQ